MRYPNLGYALMMMIIIGGRPAGLSPAAAGSATAAADDEKTARAQVQISALRAFLGMMRIIMIIAAT
jgi:hypothetical protein